MPDRLLPGIDSRSSADRGFSTENPRRGELFMGRERSTPDKPHRGCLLILGRRFAFSGAGYGHRQGTFKPLCHPNFKSRTEQAALASRRPEQNKTRYYFSPRIQSPMAFKTPGDKVSSIVPYSETDPVVQV